MRNFKKLFFNHILMKEINKIFENNRKTRIELTEVFNK